LERRDRSIEYPYFFIPNGDGINDTWQIIGIKGMPIFQIYIFDRFRKLLKQLDTDGGDGTGLVMEIKCQQLTIGLK